MVQSHLPMERLLCSRSQSPVVIIALQRLITVFQKQKSQAPCRGPTASEQQNWAFNPASSPSKATPAAAPSAPTGRWAPVTPLTISFMWQTTAEDLLAPRPHHFLPAPPHQRGVGKHHLGPGVHCFGFAVILGVCKWDCKNLNSYVLL